LVRKTSEEGRGSLRVVFVFLAAVDAMMIVVTVTSERSMLNHKSSPWAKLLRSW
jgi:hypothetical protein